MPASSPLRSAWRWAATAPSTSPTRASACRRSAWAICRSPDRRPRPRRRRGGHAERGSSASRPAARRSRGGHGGSRTRTTEFCDTSVRRFAQRSRHGVISDRHADPTVPPAPSLPPRGIGLGGGGSGQRAAGAGRVLTADRAGARRHSRRRPPRVTTCRRTCRPGCRRRVLRPRPTASAPRPRRPWSAGRPTRSSASRPLADLHGTLTPNALFYEVHYGGIPAIDPSEHRLLVHGLVERPTLFTMDDLKRFPAVSVVHFLECSGNSFSEWTEASMGQTVQQTARLDQLRRVDRGAGGHHPARGRASSRVAGGCWRRGRMPPGTTAASRWPRRWPMGCSPMPPTARTCAPPRAIPLRLLLPGFEGNTNVKWLRRLKVGHRALADAAGDLPLHRSHARRDGARSSPSSWKPSRSSRPPLAGSTSPGPGFSRDHAVWPGPDADGSRGSTSRPTAGRAGLRRRCRSRCCRSPGRASACPGRGTASRPACRAGPSTRPATCSRRIAQLVEARGVNSFYHFNGIQTWDIAADGEVSNVYA